MYEFERRDEQDHRDMCDAERNRKRVERVDAWLELYRISILTNRTDEQDAAREKILQEVSF
jgi:hypothetical protein